MKTRNILSQPKSLLALAIATISASASAADSFTDALTGGKVSADLRYRYENVRNPGKAVPNNADAQTVRLRLGYETARYMGFGAMVEAAATRTVFGGNNYNSLACTTAFGCTSYAVVADPVATEINQSYLSYNGIPETIAKWGRQRLILDNARFVGNVGWRQNEQTYNAFTLVNQSLPDTTFTVGYITNVNRVFTNNAIVATTGAPATGATAGNHKMSSTILNMNYKGWRYAALTAYSYLLDYDRSSGFTANSTNTYGLRLNGNAPVGGYKALYTAEYASQSNAKLNNATSYTVNYALLEGGMDFGAATLKLGYEILGSNGNAATSRSFSTPLATLHAFNGWADMFLATPPRGLKDAYMSANTALSGVKLAAICHDFRADRPDATANHYGTEWDALAARNFGKNYSVGLKLARFRTRLAASYPDTDKIWLWAEAKF
ncbi:MAG: hypothetical protein GC139_00405 [Sideroxydans sp.]|nr:hypothetical protein [Sideroxydans sp.]